MPYLPEAGECPAQRIVQIPGNGQPDPLPPHETGKRQPPSSLLRLIWRKRRPGSRLCSQEPRLPMHSRRPSLD